MKYILNLSEYVQRVIDDNGFSFEVYDILPQQKASDFIALQELAEKEIPQEINVLRKEALMVALPFRAECFQIILVYHDEDPVGYGYCHLDDNFKNMLYLNTIYVKDNYRKRKVAYLICKHLIESSLSKYPNINRISAITQPNNDAAIALLTSLDFKP